MVGIYSFSIVKKAHQESIKDGGKAVSMFPTNFLICSFIYERDIYIALSSKS